ncbi:PPC domain-containing protein [Planctomicrobium sp. SH668]|uniref:PPC domain-containing protein n=1 Tax=Planctomicrobium sp. SH668 TaxID=3448126 RepID=UPI003F5B7E74
MRFLYLTAVYCVCVIFFSLHAEAANPQVRRAVPHVAQRGTEVEVMFRGERIDDTEEVLLYDSGMEVLELESIPKKEGERRGESVRVKFKIAADCPLGSQRLRLRTKTGLSQLLNFHVTALPVVEEAEPNTEFTAPQSISKNVTVAGRITSEDVDYYSFEAKKGERISAEVFGMRMGLSTGSNYFDPYVAILNSDRFELAANDDHPLVLNDAIASVIAPEDGTYFIQIRDASYNGDGNAIYCLHIGNFPRPTAVIPSGGKPGETIEVTFIGDVAGPIKQQVTLPAEIPVEKFSLSVTDEQGIAPSGVPFMLSNLDNFTEVEPNGDAATATVVTVPGAFNGVISEKGDVDYYKFNATKDQEFQFEVYGRRIRSGLDSFITIVRVRDGAGLVADDDARRPDAALKYKFPEDGEYAVVIRDHLMNGDPTFAYRVEVTNPTPYLEAQPTEFARYVGPQIVIPQGGGFGIVANVTRQEFGGPVNFRSEDLPPGVRVECAESWRNDGTASVMFYAAEDAPLGGKFSHVEAFLDNPAEPDRKVTGRLFQDTLMILARNDERVWEERMNRLPIVVVEKMPFKVWIETPAVPVVKGGSIELKVRCEKAEGWDEEIRLVMLQNPPGMSSNGSAVIPKGALEANMTVNASDGAPVRENMLAIRCLSTFNGGEHTYLTQPVPLRVADRYLGFEFAQGAVEQGKEIPYLIKIDQSQPFEGEAVVELLGLPANSTAEPLKMTKETAELTFTVKAAEDTPPGMSQNVFCRVMVPENGDFILHNLGTGRLRVDKPTPPPAPTEGAPMVETPAAPVAAPEAPPKPLSRLEQLRLQAQQKAAAGQ